MLEAGKKLGPYEIVSPLGAGGMGEVYRARDGRLGRDVAIKVLPQHLSADPEVRARFEREARTVSGLNHPNICTLFDVGREGEIDFLVLELIEGETLSERLRKGPLSTAELVRFGVQVADALDRAHRAGVIHRDLKPGNVMITRSGAKLMDFGLARATGMAGATGSGASMAALTQSPTVAHALTAEGTIIGTFQYMSPEQLEGRDADTRSDIWAFGCLLYEMATGRRAFEGRSQASLIAAILEREPAPVADVPSGSSTPGAPPIGLDRLIRACLVKDPEERLQTAHDAKLQLQWVAESAGMSSVSVAQGGPAPAAPARRADVRLPWAIAAVALVAAGGFAAYAWPRLNAPRPAYRFNPDTDPPGSVESFWPRLSPDGRMLAFQATDSSGARRAWVLNLNETVPRPIPATEGLQRCYWSPDSREIVFVAGAKIQRVPVAGGTPAIICPAPNGADLSWGSKGQVLLDGRFDDSIRVVPAAGGELRPATRIDRLAGERGSAWPSFLPDGEHFLFIGILGSGNGGNIRLGKLGSLESKALGVSDGRVEYAPGGWLLFVKGPALVAQKLDLGARKLTGQPITIIDDLRLGNASGHFSPSLTGALAFARGEAQEGTELHRANRKGELEAAVLVSGTVANPRLSPDGRRLLYERGAPGTNPWGDVHVYDLARNTDTRLTFTNGLALSAHWSPDGRRFAYTSENQATGRSVLMIGSADGLGSADSIPVPSGTFHLSQWAQAGSRLVGFTLPTPYVVMVATDGTERAIQTPLDTTTVMAQPVISPDGRFIATVQGTNTAYHVFVNSLEGSPGRWQITPMVAGRPRWTKGGRELVFETADGRLMAVAIDTSRGFEAGVPEPLFSLPRPSRSIDLASWACDDQGERFIVSSDPMSRAAKRAFEVATDFSQLVNRK
ncbi:MAG: serine/threonine-protein kinase [Candidatus Eisenbacteria bacterium]|nr:serine/threonine-protein kinase [Candidatus Eisenbacteria bacterium]